MPDPWGEPWVSWQNLPEQSRYILSGRRVDPNSGGIILETPFGYELFRAPRGGGWILAEPDWQRGTRRNIIRVQPPGTPSAVRNGYENGYYVVYNDIGSAISVYSGRVFKDNNPKVHNALGVLVPR